MRPFTPDLDWVARQRERMERLVCDWASIPSETHDVGGLAAMAAALERSFAVLGASVLVDLPPATEIDGGGRAVEQPLGRLSGAQYRRLDRAGDQLRLERRHPVGGGQRDLVGHRRPCAVA